MDLGDRKLSKDEEAAAASRAGVAVSTGTCSGPFLPLECLISSSPASVLPPQSPRQPEGLIWTTRTNTCQRRRARSRPRACLPSPPPLPGRVHSPAPQAPPTHRKSKLLSGLSPTWLLGVLGRAGPSLASQGTEVRVIINRASVQGEALPAARQDREPQPLCSCLPRATGNSGARAGLPRPQCGGEGGELGRREGGSEQHDSGLARRQGRTQPDVPLCPLGPSAWLLALGRPLAQIRQLEVSGTQPSPTACPPPIHRRKTTLWQNILLLPSPWRTTGGSWVEARQVTASSETG